MSTLTPADKKKIIALLAQRLESLLTPKANPRNPPVSKPSLVGLDLDNKVILGNILDKTGYLLFCRLNKNSFDGLDLSPLRLVPVLSSVLDLINPIIENEFSWSIDDSLSQMNPDDRDLDVLFWNQVLDIVDPTSRS